MSKVNREFDGLGAVVLCGGKSQRMGIDKWRLPIGDETMLQYVVRGVSSICSGIVVASGSVASSELDMPNVDVVLDLTPSSGPLEGIRAGLEFLSAKFEFAYVTACDIPYFNCELVGHMFDNVAGYEAVIPCSGDRIYGMTAIYKTSIHNRIGRMINQRRLKVSELANYLKSKTISDEVLKTFDTDLKFLKNVNRPEDYLELLHSLGLECDIETRRRLAI